MRHFILIDFDAVSVHNLNRQFVYNQSSVGKLKISECRDYIAGINPNADAGLYHKEMTQPQDLRVLDPYEIDIVINAADKPHNISEWVYRYCKERNIAFMTGVSAANGGLCSRLNPINPASPMKKHAGRTSELLPR